MGDCPSSKREEGLKRRRRAVGSPEKKSGDGGRRRVSNYRPSPPPPSPNGGRSEKTWTEFEKKAATASVVWREVGWERVSEEGDKIAGGGRKGKEGGGAGKWGLVLYKGGEGRENVMVS